MNIYERRNSILGMEFDRYIREHPEFCENIPQNAHIVLLLENDDKFNEWSANLVKNQAEKDQPIVYIIIKKMAPAHSRIRTWNWFQVKIYKLSFFQNIFIFCINMVDALHK